MKTISRLQFLRGDFHGDRPPARPPWSLDEESFLSNCSRCGDCIESCSQKILEKDLRGFPTVNFLSGSCSFCGDCARICPDGAFRPLSSEPWCLKADIRESCLTRQGTVCRVCQEECEPGAIIFEPGPKGMFRPVVSPHLCTGCGACVRHCPSGAIFMEKVAGSYCNKEQSGGRQ